MKRRYHWSPQEDKALQTAMLMYGYHASVKIKWSLIAARVEGRTNKQCRDRWINGIRASSVRHFISHIFVSVTCSSTFSPAVDS
jgi:hypothetical protein